MTTLTLNRAIVAEQKFETINRWMSTGQGSDLPKVLQGIYFMDGNDLPDDCLTLNTVWDAQTRTLQLPVFGPQQWTFHPSLAGRSLLKLVKILQLVYEIRFEDETLRHAVVIPKILGFRVPRWITEFTMTQTPESLKGEAWDRKNTIFFRLIPVGGYVLRKIVDGRGRKTPAFAKMLAQVQKTCIVVVNTEIKN
ncbi:hypothetical protein [Acaryochloris sp. IP29b_bin.148]|uniref:hypothetical protein n=1 Tax=Acaryochloris sp. IP29b_bin.148 TaxID=2969218 RepID=UPI00261F2CAF|nr:hypothetical protein [Acaryochloris sp. IP29b_bin.148]